MEKRKLNKARALYLTAQPKNWLWGSNDIKIEYNPELSPSGIAFLCAVFAMFITKCYKYTEFSIADFSFGENSILFDDIFYVMTGQKQNLSAEEKFDTYDVIFRHKGNGTRGTISSLDPNGLNGVFKVDYQAEMWNLAFSTKKGVLIQLSKNFDKYLLCDDMMQHFVIPSFFTECENWSRIETDYRYFG